MPFNPSTGIYTPPTGAENAAPGGIIKSAVWNTVFTDISAALTQLGQKQPTMNPTILSTSGNYTVQTTDTLVIVEASTPTITLPNSTTKLSNVTIVGNASSIFGSNNSLLVTTSSQTINGLLSKTLTTNYQSILLIPLSAGGWLIGP